VHSAGQSTSRGTAKAITWLTKIIGGTNKHHIATTESRQLTLLFRATPSSSAINGARVMRVMKESQQQRLYL